MDLNTIAICFLLTCLQAGCCRTECRISAPETELDRLKGELLCGYDNSIRPEDSKRNTTLVLMHMIMRRFTLMESSETIDVHYGISLVWEDERLKWEPSHYGKISRFNMNYSSIWTPQIGWITKGTDNDRLYMGMIPCLVEWFGRVFCVSWSSFHTECQSDFTHWPYDSHICKALLAPWILQRREVELLPMNQIIVIPQIYQPNTEWALLNAGIGRRSEMFENATFDYAELTLTLQRHSATYEATVLIPALVLVVLTLASSWIEAGCPTRLSLLCTLVVCHILYMKRISLYFSYSGSGCPLILVFYRDSMMVCGLSFVVTLLVRWMSWTSATPPSWMSDVAIKVQGSLPGQLLLFFQHPQQVADTEGTETSSQIASNWNLIGRLLDRISFFTFIVIYFVLLIEYYLYYL